MLTPFFAEENVPSAKASSWLTSPRRSSLRSSRVQAFSQRPSMVHSLCRRQQVEEEGKTLGKSFQRAPDRRIQRIPSKHAREDARGRPPYAETGRSGNKSAIRSHCSSLSCALGSFLDPATAPAAASTRDRSCGMQRLLSDGCNRKRLAKRHTRF